MPKIIITLLTLLLFSPLIGEQAGNPEEEELKRTAADIHGFADAVFKNDYMTPRGLLVTDTELTIQLIMGLSLDVYKSSQLNVSFFFGIWNDLWTGQDDPFVGCWNECDWFIGFDFSFCKYWKLRTQFIEFVSPPHNFKPENNLETTLSYDDSHFNCPIVFNPYVRLFWAISGDSTIVVGRPGNTYYVEFGLTPTVTLNKCITLSAPTWISVGPANFWNGGDLALKNVHSHFGVFSTGIKGNLNLDFIPKTLGNWYLDTGVQYYYLINRNLLQAQKFTLGICSLRHAKRNVFVGYGGFGFAF